MYSEARKIHLLEDVLKEKDEAILIELESVLRRSRHKASGGQKPSIYDFVGILSKEEADEMRKAIEETCETINPDDWK